MPALLAPRGLRCRAAFSWPGRAPTPKTLPTGGATFGNVSRSRARAVAAFRESAASSPRPERDARHRSQPSHGCTDSSRPPIDRRLLAGLLAQGGLRDRRSGNEVSPRLFMSLPSADEGPTGTGHKIALGNQAQSCAGIAGKVAPQASPKPWTRKPWTPVGPGKHFSGLACN